MKTSLAKKFVVASVALISCASFALPSHAQTMAYTTSGTETDLTAYGLSGFEFTPTANIDVTALGFTSLDLGGGDAIHVTLWNASAGLGSLTQIYDTGNIHDLVTATPDNTPTNPGEPSFVSVGTPILLTAGTTYLISAPSYWTATFNSSGLTSASALGTTEFLSANSGWGGSFDNSSYNFSALTAASSSQTPTTANLEFTLAPTLAVPEPSTYVSFGAGLLILLIRLRRRSVKLGC